MVLIILAFMKILFFMKIFSDYGFLVQMVFLSFLDMGPFMAFFSLWLLFFTIEFKVLGFEFDDSEYANLGSFTQMLILTFRNSIGDLSLPQYNDLIEVDTSVSQFVIYMLWMFWFMNIFLMVIMLLNFLIAVISQTYERVSGSQTSYTYKDKADMN